MEHGSEIVYGLELVSIRRMDLPDTEYLEKVERLLSSIDGHPAVRMILQTTINPVAAAPRLGTRSVHLLLVGDHGLSSTIEELVDDVLDLLSVPPHIWSFRPMEDVEELGNILDSTNLHHFAEVSRRQTPCPQSRGFAPVGYDANDEPTAPTNLWNWWRFDPTDRSDASLLLLSQDHRIVVRAVVGATELNADERDYLEENAMSTGFETSIGGIQAASGRVLERMLVGAPLYDTRILVASPSPIGAAVLTAIGWSISPPQDRDTHGMLSGGFDIVRSTGDLDEVWGGLGLAREAPGNGVVSRIRRILTMVEAATAFGLPTPTAAPSPGLQSIRSTTMNPPIAELPTNGSLIGHSVVGGATHDVNIRTSDRMRHTYVTGQTGTGKSTLLGNLILDDINRGAGVAVVDPHGSLVQAILERIPDDRIDDVIVIEPADRDAVVGVNLLDAETEIQKTFIVAELVSMFYALFDPGHTGIVGPRYETWLRQGARLLLANPQRASSFLDIPTVFTDSKVQQALVANIDDVVLAEFWRGEIAQTTDYHKSEVLAWFRSKFEPFRLSSPVRRIVGQAESTVSFDDALRDSRIILVNLSKGHLGSYNANLIGFIVMTRLWQATLGRAAAPDEDHPDFFIYADEFQNLTTNSLAEMLSEARKFGVGITLANQFLGQISGDIQSAIMGNVSTKLAFRVGPKDAELFSSWMGTALDSDDLIELENHKVMASLSNDGRPLDPLVVDTVPLKGEGDPKRAELVRERSRQQWATPVAEIDEAFRNRWADIEGSFSHSLDNPKAPPPKRTSSSSFLDEWLAKREAAKQDDSEIGGESSEADPADDT